MTTARHRIRCGHCQQTHTTTDAVRACHNGAEPWPCDWLYEAGWNEDGERIIRECGAESWTTPTGYTCANGHEHVSARARAEQGWDYAADPEEAEGLRRNFVDARAMDGAAI